MDIADWTGGEYEPVILFDFLDPTGNPFVADAVTWQENGVLDFTATFNVGDDVVEVEIADTTDVRSFTTITNSFRADGTIAEQVQVFDDGRETTKLFDAGGTIVSSTTLDLLDNFSYLSTSTLFTAGVRSSSAVVGDNGVTTVSNFDAGGVITDSLATDIDMNTNFATIAITYVGGVISERTVDYDTHPSLDEIVTTYDGAGAQVQSVRTLLNGTVQHIGVGANDNTFQSTASDDIFTGNGGVDTFVFNELVGDDRITDFDTANELIDLSLFGISTVADLQANATLTDQTNGNLLIDFTAGDTLTLNGVVEADLADTNFV